MWNEGVKDFDGVLHARLVAAILWSCVLQIIPLSIYLLIGTVNILHPTAWLKEVLTVVFTFRTWLTLLPLFIQIGGLAVILFTRSQTQSPCYTTRFRAFCSIFSKKSLLTGFLYCCIGTTISWIYLGLQNNCITEDCSTFPNRKCIREENIFLVLNGFWTGAYYFLWSDYFDYSHLTFPIVQQFKFLQVKSQILNLVKQAALLSFWPTGYFITLYYFQGCKITSLIQDFFKLQNEADDLTSVAGFFNIPLFLHSWLLAALFFLIIAVLKLLLQVHLTYHYSFPILIQKDIVSLPCALKSNNFLVMNLAYYDLYTVSLCNTKLRSEVFSLSQPGGHPHVWNTILQECLQLMDRLANNVNNLYKPPPVEVIPSPKPKPIHVHQSLHIQEHLTNEPKLRNLVSNGDTREMYYRAPVTQTILDQQINNFLVYLMNKPGIHYIFGELPDVNLHCLLSDAQSVIWASQSIATLASVSLVEDQYGIVLKDLPRIIHTLLFLKSAIDKVYKFGNVPFQRKLQRSKFYDFCMKNALKSAIKRSLYKIAVAYAEYLKELPISEDDYKNMRCFVNFKE